MTTKPVVLASVAAYGLMSKQDRGVFVEASTLPDALLPLQGKLNRLASRLQVDLNQSRGDLLESIRVARSVKTMSGAAASPSLDM